MSENTGRKSAGDGKNPGNFPLKKLSLINFNNLLCAKDSERLQHNSCTVLLLFQNQFTDNAVNKLAIGTEGGQKLIRKSSGSLHKKNDEEKGDIKERSERNTVFFGFLRQQLLIPLDALGSSPSQQPNWLFQERKHTTEDLICLLSGDSNCLDSNTKQSQQLLPEKQEAEHGWISNTESASKGKDNHFWSE